MTNGYLFTGDILYDQTSIAAFYPSTDPIELVNSLKKICDIKGVRKVFGSHNTLGLDREVLTEAKEAIQYLEEKKLVEKGNGLHSFNTISFLF